MENANKTDTDSNMKRTVYVIGAGTGLDAIERAKKVLELKEDVEIICVESMEDVPTEIVFSSDPSIIRQIHELKPPPIIPMMPYFEDKKRKGHERPYKYHR